VPVGGACKFVSNRVSTPRRWFTYGSASGRGSGDSGVTGGVNGDTGHNRYGSVLAGRVRGGVGEGQGGGLRASVGVGVAGADRDLGGARALNGGGVVLNRRGGRNGSGAVGGLLDLGGVGGGLNSGGGVVCRRGDLVLRDSGGNGHESSNGERLHFDCGGWYYYAEVLSIGRGCR
jgi:hypothetical protein